MEMSSMNTHLRTTPRGEGKRLWIRASHPVVLCQNFLSGVSFTSSSCLGNDNEKGITYLTSQTASQSAFSLQPKALQRFDFTVSMPTISTVTKTAISKTTAARNPLMNMLIRYIPRPMLVSSCDPPVS